MSGSPPRSPYRVLGVDPNMDFRTIQHVWRDRCRRYRDARLGLGPAAEPETQRVLAELNAAFHAIRAERLGEDGVPNGARPAEDSDDAQRRQMQKVLGMAVNVGAALREVLASGGAKRLRAAAEALAAREDARAKAARPNGLRAPACPPPPKDLSRLASARRPPSAPSVAAPEHGEASGARTGAGTGQGRRKGTGTETRAGPAAPQPGQATPRPGTKPAAPAPPPGRTRAP